MTEGQQLDQKDAEALKNFRERLKKGDSFQEALKYLPKDFFNNKSQERSKTIFSSVMRDLLGATVEFPRTEKLDSPDRLTGSLDSEVFHRSHTHGVQNDIPRSSMDKQHTHVYQVASQYNAAEATRRYTPPIGGAMAASAHDYSQGPLAQRSNPIIFELVTAFLTHLGFNMLNEVLPLAGKTYEEKAAIAHGYLCPDKNNIDALTNEFKTNFANTEYVCYSSLPSSAQGAQPVYIFLQAAPAIDNAKFEQHLDDLPSDDLEKHVALANYLGLFRYGINLAKRTGKPVVLHATAVGGDMFGNKRENIEWGFEKAALALQGEMKQNQVSVQLEVYVRKNGTIKSATQDIGNNLNIEYKERVGDPKNAK